MTGIKTPVDKRKASVTEFAINTDRVLVPMRISCETSII